MKHKLVVSQKDDNHFVISGSLVFSTVMLALAKIFRKKQWVGSMSYDLSGVKHADSACLTFLLESMRRVEAVGGDLTVKSPPESLMELAKVSGLDTIIPFMLD